MILFCVINNRLLHSILIDHTGNSLTRLVFNIYSLAVNSKQIILRNKMLKIESSFELIIYHNIAHISHHWVLNLGSIIFKEVSQTTKRVEVGKVSQIWTGPYNSDGQSDSKGVQYGPPPYLQTTMNCCPLNMQACQEQSIIDTQKAWSQNVLLI